MSAGTRPARMWAFWPTVADYRVAVRHVLKVGGPHSVEALPRKRNLWHGGFFVATTSPSAT